jgi:hypothetical protein
MHPFPPVPAHTARSNATVHLRFQDVTQDGRLVLEALPNALGPTVWRGILAQDPATTACVAAGIVPILSRYVLEGAPGPFSPNIPLEAEGTCRLARVEDGRFVLEMWAELHGVIGSVYGASPHPAERAAVGRVYAEHVLTRLFAPPGERRVTTLDFPGAPAVTETRRAPPSYESIASAPPAATLLEPARRVDAVPLVFGLVHTDSNMHVNSLAYVRMFEEAALRRFVALGRSARVLARRLDIAYRKPCFAGQTVRVALQAFEVEGSLGAAGVIVDESDAVTDEALARAKPHAYACMAFDA